MSIADLLRESVDRVLGFGGTPIGGAAPSVFPGTTAPQTPAKGPSDDMRYLSHAFEALAPVTLSAWDVERIRHARDEHALGT